MAYVMANAAFIGMLSRSLQYPTHQRPYSCNFKLGHVRQRSVFTFVNHNFLHIELDGMISANEIVAYSLNSRQELECNLPLTLQRKIGALGTRLDSVVYVPSEDHIKLIVRPPFRWPIEVILTPYCSENS